MHGLSNPRFEHFDVALAHNDQFADLQSFFVSVAVFIQITTLTNICKVAYFAKASGFDLPAFLGVVGLFVKQVSWWQTDFDLT